MTQTITAPAAARKAPAFVLITLAGIALLALSAQFKVPFYPVPMTLQTLVVLALPLFFGWRGVSSVVAYLAIGAAGLPVFAAGGGIGYFFGPTGGFLLGFVAAAVFVALFAKVRTSAIFWYFLAAVFVADGLMLLWGFSPGFLLEMVFAAFAMFFFGKGEVAAAAFWRTLGVLLIAGALIFLSGVVWLAQFIGFDAAVQKGLLPFALGDMLKVVVVAVAYHLWRRRAESA